MFNSWYQDIYKSIEKYFKLKVPIELIHFPSVGITSSLSRIAIENKDKHNHTQLLIVDLRAGLFSNKDNIANKKEFYRILKSHLEQHLNFSLGDSADHSIYKNLEASLLQKHKLKEDVVIVLFTSAQFDVTSIAEFRDFLLFIDRLRGHTNGAINLLISTTYPLFNEESPAPIPLISRYYNYYDRNWLKTAITKAIFKDKADDATISTIIELTGGMASLAKYLRNDLDYYFLKPEGIFNHNLNSKFFEDFMYTKVGIERIAKQLHPSIKESLIKYINHEKLSKEEFRTLETYLLKTGFSDSNGEIRSKLILNYFSKEEVTESIGISEEKPNEEISKYIEINNIKIDRISGEIYFGNIKSDDFLSEIELDLIKLLAEKNGEKVKRDIIASRIWPEKQSEYYSDWAIDKLISRIRDKLKDTKPHRVIKTVRNYGFRLGIS